MSISLKSAAERYMPLVYMTLKHRKKCGRIPNILFPHSFNEHILNRMLFRRDPLLQTIVDKVEVRRYVSQKGYSEILTPILGVYETPEQIEWDTLPEQFVIKVSFGSKMTRIVLKRNEESWDNVREELKNWMARDYKLEVVRWLYSAYPRRIIIEEIMTDRSGNIPNDVKLFMFGGQLKFVQVDVARFGEHRRSILDEEWNLLPVTQLGLPSAGNVSKPSCFDAMHQIARDLAQDFDFMRVDLYDLNGAVRFGELTPFHDQGNCRMDPVAWDFRLGEYFDSVNG